MADKKQTMLYGLLTSIASKITYDNAESGLTADNVQDAIDEINNKFVYSTEETIIGKWIDGKPIYRKTLVVTSPSSEAVTTNYQLEMQIDLPLRVEAFIVDTNGVVYNKGHQIFERNSSTNHFELSQGFWCWGSGNSSSNPNTLGCQVVFPSLLNLPMYVTIDYTKP